MPGNYPKEKLQKSFMFVPPHLHMYI